MYVLSQEAIALKKGEGDHNGKVFVNKARKGEGVANTPEGLATLAKAISGAKLGDRTLHLIGRGQVGMTEVATGLATGEVMAFQYQKEGYAEPKWQINLGFVTDVDAKNAGYAAKRSTVKAPAAKGKKAKVGLIS